MIIRETLACETCGHVHTVRIGMGHEERQLHKFPCRGCQLPIAVALNVDFKEISALVSFEENAIGADRTKPGTIVNLDANYVIPDSEQGKDFSFSRLAQLHQLIEQRIAKTGELPVSAGAQAGRPDFRAEWESLRQAWVLFRNKQDKLVAKRLAEASRRRYPDNELGSLADWVWRFSMKISGMKFDELFRAIMKFVEEIGPKNDLTAFFAYYESQIAGKRGARYLELFGDFFRSYGEFAQVHFLVASEIDIPADHNASSVDFDSTKMFYGNAFETFAVAMDIYAMVNNLSEGREFDTFRTMKLADYLKLDHGSRFKCLEENPILRAACSEADNQLRNASHHRNIEFNDQGGTLTYEVGKGGAGPAQSITYADYLSRCSKIFLQVVNVLRLEIMLSEGLGTPPPL